MATQRIESGRVQMAGVGGVPMQQITPRQIDYTTAANIQARGANQLAQVIDRMSQTAFQVAGELSKGAAMEDVANTPLTPEQLEIAKNGDTSFLDLGSPLNIYSATVRKARSFELASAFDTEAKAEVVKIMADIEAGTATSEIAAKKINTLTNGFTQSLAQVDGDAALKFRASMGVYANTVMAEAYKAEQKRNREQGQLKFESNFANTMKLVEAALVQGFFVDARDGTALPVEPLLEVYRNNLSDSAFATGGLPYAKEKLTQFDAQVAEAKVNAATKIALGDDYMADPVLGLQKLRSGDLGPMSGVFMTMPQDDKSKVIANYMVAINQRDSAAKAADEDKKQAAIKEFVPLYNEAVALPNSSPKRKQLIAQIKGISNANPNAVPLSVMSSLLSPDKDGDGDPMVEFNMLAGIYNGTITDPSQIYSRVGKGLTGKQAVSLLGKLVSEDRRDQGELDRGISQLAGIPVIPGQVVVIDPKGEEFKRRNELVADAEAIRLQAASEGKILTPRQILQELNKQIETKRNSESAKQARTQLDTYAKKDWINGPITRDSLATLERKAGNDRVKQNELKRIRTLLDQAEGRN